MRWFRFYNDAPGNSKLKLLAFEDRWHFVAILCMKSAGLLDTKKDELRERRIAAELSLSIREAEEVKRRLLEVDLITKNWQPVGWNDRQYEHDSSAPRTRKYREKKKKLEQDVTSQERHKEVTVTSTETETDQSQKQSRSDKNISSVFTYWQQKMGRPKAKLTNDRRQKIQARFSEGYSVDDIKLAIDGCANSDFHQGQNDQRKTYDELTLICRTGSKVEDFMKHASGKKKLQLKEL